MSKFDKLFEARDESVKEEAVQVPKKTRDKTPSVKSKKSSPATPAGAGSKSEAASDVESTPVVAAAPQAGNKQRGRPKAKRSNPDFIGFTTYIRKDTHLMVKILLLQEGGREMSELVEELLTDWIKKK